MVAGPVIQRPNHPDSPTLPYDRRLSRRLAEDLLLARRELAACRAAAAAAADRHARELSDERAESEARVAALKATETWRVGVAVVALPRWVRRRFSARSQ